MSKLLPKEMNSLVLKEFNSDPKKALQNLEVITKEVPQPKKGQVLVKIEAASCNPSDLAFMSGSYSITKELPCAPGFEGAGKVIASGGGFLANFMMNKRVACGFQGEGDGAWSQYAITEAKSCIPLRRGVPASQGAYMIVNPLSAVGLIDYAKIYGSSVIVQTAAASQLARIVQKLAKKESITVINIVRREEQVKILQDLGEKYILNSSNENFWGELSELTKKLGASTAIDAVAGGFTGKLIQAMPPGSQVIVYGTLSGEPCSGVATSNLSYEGKTLRGFHLSRWVKERGVLKVMKSSRRLQKLIKEGVIATQIQETVSLQNAASGIEKYLANPTAGKVLIEPHQN